MAIYSADLIPTMTTYDAPSGLVTESGHLAGYDGWEAMRDDNSDQGLSWVAPEGTTAWLGYQFTSAKVIQRYTITSRNEGGGLDRVPKSWTLEASNTGAWGGEEVVLDTQANITDWAALPDVTKTFSFTNATGYAYYRLDITASNDANWVGVGEFELMMVSAWEVNVHDCTDLKDIMVGG